MVPSAVYYYYSNVRSNILFRMYAYVISLIASMLASLNLYALLFGKDLDYGIEVFLILFFLFTGPPGLVGVTFLLLSSTDSVAIPDLIPI
mmetsp:Transcript_2519/g.3249  ORF Transcript_2519/g.3249 Transcript_2519/m.3249 type:complete len:90 (+) Transcript_2519:162-431(+)